MMVRLQYLMLLLQMPAVAAFSPPAISSCCKSPQQQSTTTLNIGISNGEMEKKVVGAAAIAGAFLAFSTTACPAMAETPMVNYQESQFASSSSIQLSETIKTMEFSLPSSYDSISDAKASGVDNLVQEENVLTGTKVKKAVKKEKSSSGGFGGQAMTPEEKAAIAAQKRAEREAAAEEKAALEAEKKAEKEAIAAAKQAEKEALAAERAAEKAQSDAERAERQKELKAAKEKAEALKAVKAEEKAKASTLKGAEFVDMGMPSYGSSTSQKEKSVFSVQ